MSKYFKAWIKDQNVLRKSSSGGIFTALAIYVIKQGGIVFGARQFPDNALMHIAVSTVEDIGLLRKSKYYQSDFTNVYEQVRELLIQGIPVLVSGTACQIASLYGYLDINNVNAELLVTIDVLCHGVSNRSVYERYLESQSRHFRNPVKHASFRTKAVPWEKGGGTSMTLFFSNGRKKIIPWKKDPYYLGFNNDLILRPSCYSCRFVGQKRVSDFTLADFWGITDKDVDAEHLNTGVSLLIANTGKAEQIMTDEVFRGMCYFAEVSSDLAVPHNSALHERRKKHKNRDRFFKNVFQDDYNKLIRSCLQREIIMYRIKGLYHAIFG